MAARLVAFACQNWGLLSVLLLMLAVALWFAAQVVLDFFYFHDPAHVDVDLKPWMTPRFIVLTYDLPRPFVFDTLGLDDKSGRGQRLGRVAREMGVTMEEVTAQVRDAAEAYRRGDR
ncbi:hypothetical protein [Jannaschia sp. W003]|uniref:hypothetical protein n=1 Tax=Jannaschia sp. W003 TaxID=2867012 RepID=UPI0021A7700B|nr:hypothetical protein [Jannaschia sp. W003]UWQ20138.1 hypothetical protein K3554_08975 [Jannaschia sp. W003]